MQKGTYLHVAAELGYIGVAVYLMRHHPPLMNMQDRFGRTPLHLCALHGMVLMAQVLLVSGADYRIRDNNYKTPLDYAAKGTYPG